MLSAEKDSLIKNLYEDNKSKMTEWIPFTITQIDLNLSGYANTNINEFIAEAWSEYQNNPNPRPLSKQVSERLFELYKEKFKK